MRVSAVIPAYNVEVFINETIESVLNQTYPVNEVIVVDDGSTDRTAVIAESFGGSVHVFHQSNAGASVARNRALEYASGDFIAFLDADDLWEPCKIQQQIAYLTAHPEVGAVAASFLVFGEVTPTRVVKMVDTKLLNLSPFDFLASPRIYPSTLVCRNGLVRAIRFPEGIADGEDVIYAALLRTQAPIGAVEEVLMRRREHPAQLTKTHKHFSRGVQARISWAKSNYELLGLRSAEEAATAILHAAVEDVLAIYWSRDVVRFKSMRSQLLDLWPEGEPVSKNLQRPLPPLFLLHLKDLYDAWRSAKHSS
jgi:glycosyltransferase involved in cell wall biosynthesis